MSFILQCLDFYCRRRGSAGRCHQSTTKLSTVSKVLERLVLARLRPHLANSKNFSKRGSRPTGEHIRPRRRCSMSLTASMHTAADSIGSHIAYRPRSVRSLRYGLSLNTWQCGCRQCSECLGLQCSGFSPNYSVTMSQKTTVTFRW